MSPEWLAKNQPRDIGTVDGYMPFSNLLAGVVATASAAHDWQLTLTHCIPLHPSVQQSP